MTIASELIQRVKLGVSGVSQQIGSAQEFVRKHPVTSAVTVGGGALAGAGIVQIIRKARKKTSKAKASSKKPRRKSKSKRKKYFGHTKRGWKLDRAKRSKEKHELAYQRRKRKGKTSKKRIGKIYYTKKGQPYKIMASGKARFIKKTKRRTR